MDYENVHPLSHYEYVIQVDSDTAILKLKVFEEMKSLEGWCSEKKASILIDYILSKKPDRVLEIGVFGGKSLVPMAFALQANGKGKIFGIDSWDPVVSVQGMLEESHKIWWSQLDHQKIKWGLFRKIEQLKLRDYIEIWQTTSENAPLISEIDILHIDGNHSEERAYSDVLKWVPMVKKGGIILLNDMNWSENGYLTMVSAIEWLDETCHKIFEFNELYESWGIWVKL